MRTLASAVLCALLLAGCAGDPYPLPSGPVQAWMGSPVAVGQKASSVPLYIDVRPGDTIELLEATPIGSLDGAGVELFLSRPIVDADGSYVIGAQLEPLENAVVSGDPASPAMNTFGIAARLTSEMAGRFELTAVRLRYRLNGGEVRTGEGITVPWSVCVDRPAPSECPEVVTP